MGASIRPLEQVLDLRKYWNSQYWSRENTGITPMLYLGAKTEGCLVQINWLWEMLEKVHEPSSRSKVEGRHKEKKISYVEYGQLIHRTYLWDVMNG